MALDVISFVFSFSEVPLLDSLALLLSLGVITVVEVSRFVGEEAAFSVVDSVLPLSLVNVFVLEVESSLAVILLFLGEASVMVTIWVLQLTETFPHLQVLLLSNCEQTIT